MEGGRLSANSSALARSGDSISAASLGAKWEAQIVEVALGGFIRFAFLTSKKRSSMICAAFFGDVACARLQMQSKYMQSALQSKYMQSALQSKYMQSALQSIGAHGSDGLGC